MAEDDQTKSTYLI